MSNTVISIENVSKRYNLGVIGTGTFRDDLKLWWANVRNKPNPLMLVDENNHGNRNKNILWALKDISFNVEKGQALGIIGRNGAGKSTLLKILSRVTTPTSGELKVKGRISSLLEVGTGFHPELTGRENVFLNGAIMGMSKAEVSRKFDEIIDFSGVEKFIDTPVKRYSSGMYVRLAFAVAAHLEPEILIVDEVLAVGDLEFQKKCLGKMGDVTQEGRTVIFVSHNLAAISNLCKRAVLLEKGKMVSIGLTNEVLSVYLNSQVVDHNGDIDLSDPNRALRRNSFENSNFKWTHAQVINSKGDFTTAIFLKEPFSIILKGRLETATEDLVVGFGFTSKLGFPIFNSHSIDSKIQQSYSSGEVVFKIDFPENYLGPGQYTIDLGANGTKTVDWIPEAINLSIEQVNDAEDSSIRSNYDGIIIPPCKWQLIN